MAGSGKNTVGGGREEEPEVVVLEIKNPRRALAVSLRSEEQHLSRVMKG